jgi:hypothetical protein
VALVAALVQPSLLRAQEPAPGGPSGEKPRAPLTVPSTSPAAAPHRFWDAKNAALFAGVAGARALDYASTQHFRRKGVNEVLLTNAIVDNKPLFAAIEVSAVAASIGVSYLFHRTGHHKIERWVSGIHISVGTAGSIRNFGLKPNQPASTPP